MPTRIPPPSPGRKAALSRCNISACQKCCFFYTIESKEISKRCSAGAHPRVASLAPAGQFTFCTWRNILYRLQVWNLSPWWGTNYARSRLRKPVGKPRRGFSTALPAGILHELGDCNPRKTVVKYHQSNKRRLSRFNWNGEIPTVPSRRRRTHMSPDIIGAIREDAGRRTSGVGIQTLTNPAELLGTVRRGALRTRKVPAGGFFLPGKERQLCGAARSAFQPSIPMPERWP